MDNSRINLNRPAFTTVEHDGAEDLKLLLFEALELHINQKAGRVLVKKRDDHETSLFTEDVES